MKYIYTDVPSLLQGDMPKDDAVCYRCRKYGLLDFHHILNGSRKGFSEEAGAWVWLCRPCHRHIHDTSEGKAQWKKWKADCQKRYEKTHSHEEWMKGAHRSYVHDTD